MQPLQLKNFKFAELFHTAGLTNLDQTFLQQLQSADPKLHDQLLAYRHATKTLTAIEISELLIAAAKFLEEFIIELFGVAKEVAFTTQKTLSYNPIALFKKQFVLRKVRKALQQVDTLPSFNECQTWLKQQLANTALQCDDQELAIALMCNHWMCTPENYSDDLEKLTSWCARAMTDPDGKKMTAGWSSFHLPERLDYENLVPTVTVAHDKLARQTLTEEELRPRDGFTLTDPRMSARDTQDEVNYCIYCHDHEGDFCSKGFPVKKGDPTQGLKKNPLDITLTGCPLEEKISEMNLLKHEGHVIAPLAVVMIDNPMCPATGHRICNDCMKACIYQKQQPVNIPQIETRVLTDVLDLPWGVEIYDLLTRWNPLRQQQWLMKPYNGLKILIAGMGPAGFTLAHHLLLEGFAVVGFDGLKIEPLPETLVKHPIREFASLTEKLDERLMAGFGGVAEYGITVRWDKNFLKLIYLSLMRKPYFQVFGNTRIGGSLRVEDAFALGFDHFVMAVGAGLPKALPIPGSLAPGMRQANDFLMALQLGNAAKKSSLTNIQIRLPAVIIGGGLTGVDTATEVQAYYIRQVEKIAHRTEKLIAHLGEKNFYQQLDPASREILKEFLTHAKAIKVERQRAKQHHEQPNFIKLIRAWGGVTIVYRRTMQDSPAYVYNHEELKKALEEGIFYLGNLEPIAVERNQYDFAETLLCQRHILNDNKEWETLSETIRIPARSIFVATGTQPNIAYEFEHRGTFTRLGLQYQHYENIDGQLTIPHDIQHCKTKDFGPFTSYHHDHHHVSLIGDTHPVFHGSVVKAIASGMRTYPKILQILQNKLGKVGNDEEYQQFAQQMKYLFTSQLTDIKRCTDNVIELTIHAPLAAKHFKPGQFYRVQNFETGALTVDGTSLQIEPLALTALSANHHDHTLKFMIIEKGASSRLCSTFKIGQPIALMGPTGVRAKISHEQEVVIIIGDQSSIPFLHSYGEALRAQGNRVIFIGIFQHRDEVYCQETLENVTDYILWITQSGRLITPKRIEDYSTKGSVVDNILHYAKTYPHIPLSNADRIYLIGDTGLLKQFQAARTTILKSFFIKNPRVFGSVYSTMQCMLKGVCAQCLQWQIDPETGQRTKAIFACSWPEQPLECIDFDNVDERHEQNKLAETISRLWVDYLFVKNNITHV